ncbi:hypothetical protein BKA63DRAFT_518018, partial [Paraphoma chrysanthemicola]
MRTLLIMELARYRAADLLQPEFDVPTRDPIELVQQPCPVSSPSRRRVRLRIFSKSPLHQVNSVNSDSDIPVPIGTLRARPGVHAIAPLTEVETSRQSIHVRLQSRTTHAQNVSIGSPLGSGTGTQANDIERHARPSNPVPMPKLKLTFWKRRIHQTQRDSIIKTIGSASHEEAASRDTSSSANSINTLQAVESQLSNPVTTAVDNRNALEGENASPHGGNEVSASVHTEAGTSVRTQQTTRQNLTGATLPTRAENNINSSPSVIESMSEDGMILEFMNSDNLYSPERGIYVGKLDLRPPPERMEAEWRHIIRPRLIMNLMSVIGALSPSLSQAEKTIVPELCMSGTIYPGRLMVALRPTVWIRCGSKECRKAVERAVADLSHMQRLHVHITLLAPHPAGLAQRRIKFSGRTDLVPDDLADEILPIDVANSSDSNHAADWTQVIGNSTLRIRVEPISGTACGLKIHLHAANGAAYSCILGGLVMVDDEVFGLTTAHALWDSAELVGDETWVSSDINKHLIYGPLYQDECTISNQDVQWTAPSSDKHPSWIPAALHAASYAAIQSHTSQSELLTEDFDGLQNRDFALLRLNFPPDCNIYNKYHTLQGSVYGTQFVRSISQDYRGRAVNVLSLPSTTRAQLLDGDSLIIDNAGCWATRKIRMDQPLRTSYGKVAKACVSTRIM